MESPDVFSGSTTTSPGCHSAPTAARLANAALDFISANRLRNLSPDDVAAHLGCSRRLVELRLSETCGKTLHQAIEEARMEEARRRLREGETVRAIVRDMRFTSANQFYRIYKRHFGHTTRHTEYAEGVACPR